ncbi:N-acetyltransferase family protein [Streptomyces niveus]|uniref:GNAT family N-acetyltransferase n=1 Tax=Streptomyces niveus TaxID=193462 RepID=UPI0036AE783C
MQTNTLVVRRAVPADASDISGLWLRSFAAALPTVTRPHSEQQVHAWIRDIVLPTQETWVATAGETVVGMMVIEGGDVDQLYLDPDHRGRGIGARLIDLAKRRRPAGLSLWTFQINGPARRFYERQGFVPVEKTDGRGNEENEPDVRYCWHPEPGAVAIPAQTREQDPPAR